MVRHVCPVWVGFLICSPVRKLFQNPTKILEPHVYEGMKVLDIGCAMGFFSLPLAKIVGEHGKVICVDIQEKMLKSLEKRARKANLSDRIETRLSQQGTLNLDGLSEQIDFSFLFAVVHEVQDTSVLFSEIYTALKPMGRILLAEPKLHVRRNDFKTFISVSEQNGFKVIDKPAIAHSRAILLEKQTQ